MRTATCIWTWGDAMPVSVKKELSFDYGKAKTYFTCTSCSADVWLLGVEMCVRQYLQGNNGYATYNDTAKDELFPNSTAHPYMADVSYFASAQNRTSALYIALEIDGTEVLKVFSKTSSQGSGTGSLAGATDSAILSATKNSTIRYHLYADSNWNANVLSYPSVAFYFWQYSFAAQKAGNAVRYATVSSDTGFEGDSITFSVTLKRGAVWHGWYSDASCTQLVSTSQTYTITVADEDLTLYAYATREETPTGLWLKQNGAYSEVKALWRKDNGTWQEVDATAVLSSGDNIYHNNL